MIRLPLALALVISPLMTAPMVRAQAAGGLALVVAGGAVLTGSAIVDIARAPGSVSGAEPGSLAFVQRPHLEVGDRGFDLVYHPAWVLRHDAGQGSTGRSPATALALSALATFGVTAVGLGMATAGGWNDNQGTLLAGSPLGLTGMTIGPAAGHWYAGRGDRARTGLVVRILAVVAGGFGAAIIAANLEH